LGLMK